MFRALLNICLDFVKIFDTFFHLKPILGWFYQMVIILQDLSNMARFCQMVIILQERAVGDDWRVAEAASWDFGGTRATIWGGPTHYSENQPQEMGPENGERKRVKKIGATRATIWGGPTHYSENPPPGNGERKWVKRWGQYGHYLGCGGGCQNFSFTF